MDGVGVLEVVSTAGLFSVLTFLVNLYVTEKLRQSLQRENNKIVEGLKWDLKVREQSVKVAEYLALAYRLRSEDSDELYRRADQLGWELSIWLPADIYRMVAKAVHEPDIHINVLSALVEVRKYLLKSDAGNLSSTEILFHHPGAKKRSLQVQD
ncbi:hypothetical protein NPS58_17005 [Pseudomonas putida]|uniref:hypothetical protein n=1 Tax=Pseudomonas putida TaxID=303 RepID=UPI0023649BCC|nr:hypothetical protein [Pseudomonas putida]MDD2059125.1 hypothetical protein [Pseudomonas putida]